MGCNASSYSCQSAPSWIKAGPYLTSSAYNSQYVYLIDSFGVFDYDGVGAVAYGIRPIIQIAVSDL